MHIYIYIYVCVCNICRFLGLGRQPHLAPGRQATPVARPHMGERCTAEEPQNRRFFTHGVAVEVTNGYKYVCITVYIYIYNITILTMVYYFNYGFKKKKLGYNPGDISTCNSNCKCVAVAVARVHYGITIGSWWDWCICMGALAASCFFDLCWCTGHALFAHSRPE